MSADRRLTSGTARAARAAFVGTLTTTLGVGAHAAAGGMAPSPTVLGGVAVGVAALSWLLSGQHWTPRTLLAAFLLTQGAVHVTSMAQTPAHHSMGGGGLAMLLTHGLAAALLVVAVPRAEATLLSILDHLALRALRIARAVAPLTSSSRPVVAVALPHGVLRTSLPLGRAPPASV